jgi:hypothetical protein
MVTIGGKTFKNTFGFDGAYDRLAQSRRVVRDLVGPLSDWKPTINGGGEFVFEYKDGEQFIPTDHSLSQSAIVGGNQGGGFLKALRRNTEATNREKTNGINRDAKDASLMVSIMENTLFRSDRVDQKKDRLFRLWTDGTMRAILSTQYAIINSEWYLDILKEIVPEGQFTRWRGDADNMRADLLVPDTMREMDDSDYGGQIHIGNSEIGLARISGLCSIFRLVCTNGMISSRAAGIATRKVHRGEVDLVELKATIISNIKKQLKLVDSEINNVLGLKAYGVGDVKMPLVFAQLAKQYKIGRPHMQGILDGYATEAETVGVENIRSAFGVVQALTRFAQKAKDDNDWEGLETTAGRIASLSNEKWDSIVKVAGSLSDKDLADVYGGQLAEALSA